MYTSTYLTLFTFTLESIQSKIVATMQKAKIKQLPPKCHIYDQNVIEQIKRSINIGR